MVKDLYVQRLSLKRVKYVLDTSMVWNFLDLSCFGTNRG